MTLLKNAFAYHPFNSGETIMNLIHKKIKSPVGELTVIVTEKNLVAVLWENEKRESKVLLEKSKPGSNEIIKKAEKQLSEYFKGQRKVFDLPLEFSGTVFQKRVWQALTEIPYGQTMSYGALARKIGSPNTQRAVGASNGKNPVSIVVPCHRVIGSDGKLTGFAGGLKNKSYLLNLETSGMGNALRPRAV
jgi:methylated-DNA-[protein]-cysteine S-methyltransferase